MKYIILIALVSLLTIQTSWGCYDPNAATFSVNKDTIITKSGIRTVGANSFMFYSDYMASAKDGVVVGDVSDSSGNKTHQLILSYGKDSNTIIITVVNIRTAEVRVFKGSMLVAKSLNLSGSGGGCGDLEVVY